MVDFPTACPSTLRFDGARFGAHSAIMELESLVVDRAADYLVHQASRDNSLWTYGVFCHVGVSFGTSNGDGWSVGADGVGNLIEIISRPVEVGRIIELAKNQVFTEWLFER